MRKSFFLSIAFVFVAGATTAAAQNNDFLIVPGERVGRITGDASERSLRALYGDDRVQSVLVGRGEGFVCRGSRVLFDDGEYLEITWLDTESKASPDAVHIRGARWRTGNGIGLGVSLRKLEEINGKPFRLMGFDWDYGGAVISWDGGSLEQTAGDSILALTPNTEDRVRATPAENTQVSGEREFSSGHPVMQKLNPRLGRLVIFLAPKERCKTFQE